MKKEVGLWIDHREAVIVTLQDKMEDIQRIASNVEQRVRYSGASDDNQGPSHNDGSEDQRDRRIEGHLDHYYDDVIAHMQDATAVLIMGPAEAKNEFAKHLEKHHPAIKIVNIEAADKMSDAQIVAKVRRNFELYEYTH
jgi:stalled ribosome rescue protein Dom34